MFSFYHSIYPMAKITPINPLSRFKCTLDHHSIFFINMHVNNLVIDYDCRSIVLAVNFTYFSTCLSAVYSESVLYLHELFVHLVRISLFI